MFDLSAWIDLGIPTKDVFYSPYFGSKKISGWVQYPDHYRITGFELMIRFDVAQISRDSYDILAWLGDVGGIMQGLEWIGLLIVGSYYSPSNGNSYVVTQLFK